MEVAVLEKDRLKMFGDVSLNAALAVQLSWIPAVGLLEGASWASPRFVAGAHFLALAYMVAAPLVAGLRLWLRRGKANPLATARDWFLRCFLPPSLFAAGIQLVVRLSPHVTIPVILGIMIGTVPLGLYGVLLRRSFPAVSEE